MTADRSTRRTWPERASIAMTFVAALVCLAVAAALVVGYQLARSRNIAAFENPADVEGAVPGGRPATTAVTTTAGPVSTAVAPSSDGPAPAGSIAGLAPAGVTGVTATTPTDSVGSDERVATTITIETGGDVTGDTTGPTSTFPRADPEAQNFLITGADNGACIDPDSPYAGGFGDRETMGERSDTIMIIRVDPAADRAAVLSFPRDLWVEIADTGRQSRINSAYERNEPQRLADTIYNNFGIPMNHFIQVDFCAFKTLVNAVGGVAVPFEFPARDTNTGLDVPNPGCVTLDGDAALAYVRSRHYQYQDPPGTGEWQTDGTSDLGRISRQQDFLRRVLSSLLDKGPLNPTVARALIKAATDDDNVVTDAGLTIARMLEFAGVMNDVDPASITNYQIEAIPRTINGNSVLEPSIDGDNMQRVLGLFRGEVSLGDAPVQEFEQTTMPPAPTAQSSIVTESRPVASEPASDTQAPTDTAVIDTTDTDTTDAPSTASSSPEGAPEENEFGIVPPRDVTC